MKNLDLTPKEQKCCMTANAVIYAKKELSKHETKVRDHDQRTGKYSGAAHDRCNMSHCSIRFLPIALIIM